MLARCNEMSPDAEDVAALRRHLQEIDRLDVVMGKTQLCRIEDESL